MHQDLEGKAIAGWDTDLDESIPEGVHSDIRGHVTLCAGIAGIAWDAKIMLVQMNFHA